MVPAATVVVVHPTASVVVVHPTATVVVATPATVVQLYSHNHHKVVVMVLLWMQPEVLLWTWEYFQVMWDPWDLVYVMEECSFQASVIQKWVVIHRILLQI
jgi:hypothetical protein